MEFQEFKMMSANFKVPSAHIKITDLPETIELLANDGIIDANRLFLRFASPVVHAKLVENPDLTLLDLKTFRKAAIGCLLKGIYTGNTSFNDEDQKAMVMRLCNELKIDVKTTIIREGIKVDVNIRHVHNVDYWRSRPRAMPEIKDDRLDLPPRDYPARPLGNDQEPKDDEWKTVKRK